MVVVLLAKRDNCNIRSEFGSEEACQQYLASRRWPDGSCVRDAGIGRAIGRPVREPLRGELEIEEAWIGGTQTGLRGGRPESGTRHRCRGETRPRNGRYPLDGHTGFPSATLIAFLKQNVAPGSTVYANAP